MDTKDLRDFAYRVMNDVDVQNAGEHPVEGIVVIAFGKHWMAHWQEGQSAPDRIVKYLLSFKG